MEPRAANAIRQGRPGNRPAAALRFLVHDVWPLIPADQVGRRLSRDEEDAVLGYGPEGV
jgi:antitoxin VapB